MRIALDYDGTYTRDPALWDAFMDAAQKEGHEVVIVTQRFPTDSLDQSDPLKFPYRMGEREVIYTSMKPKGLFMANLGRIPDIWIDDNPHRIWGF